MEDVRLKDIISTGAFPERGHLPNLISLSVVFLSYERHKGDAFTSVELYEKSPVYDRDF